MKLISVSRVRNSTTQLTLICIWSLKSICSFYISEIWSHMADPKQRIPNLQKNLRNIYYDLFFNWQTEKKNCIGPIRSMFYFSTEKLGKTKFPWIRYQMDSMDSTLQSVRYVIKATVCANFGRDRVHFLFRTKCCP